MNRSSPGGDAAQRLFIPGEELADFRTRIRAAQAAQAAARTRELAEQSSDAHTPTVRIRLWERLHHTRLPASPDHGLVAVIATATRLSISDVQDEQARRAAPPRGVGA